MRIAFAGQMRSGKDAAAEYAIRTQGGQICKFADALYQIHDHAIGADASIGSTFDIATQVVGPHLSEDELKFEEDIWFKLWAFLKVWFNGDPEVLEHRQVGQKSRYFLQYLGTEWARQTIHPDIWVRIFLRNLSKLDPTQHIYCTDLRFHNECKALRENGFVSVRVERPEAARVAAGAANMAHPSEVDVPYLDVDFTIYNRSSLQEYYARLDVLLNPSLIERINDLKS